MPTRAVTQFLRSLLVLHSVNNMLLPAHRLQAPRPLLLCTNRPAGAVRPTTIRRVDHGRKGAHLRHPRRSPLSSIRPPQRPSACSRRKGSAGRKLVTNLRGIARQLRSNPHGARQTIPCKPCPYRSKFRSSRWIPRARPQSSLLCRWYSGHRRSSYTA